MLLEIKDTREEGSRDDLCCGFSVLHIKHCIGFPLKPYKTYLLKHKLQKTNKQTKKKRATKTCKIAEHFMYHKIDKEITVHTAHCCS